MKYDTEISTNWEISKMFFKYTQKVNILYYNNFILYSTVYCIKAFFYIKDNKKWPP